MNINSLGTPIDGRHVTLLSSQNPFRKGTLQYYLLSFIIQNHDNLAKHSNDKNNKRLLEFLSEKKEPFYIDSWNGGRMFDAAISLAIVHNIIKVTKPFATPSFGIFAEDGLFDILEEPRFTNHLPTGVRASENIKLLWLSLYMNQKIKKDNHVPKIKFNKSDFSYSEKGFGIYFSNLAYHEIFKSTLEIPLSSFSDSWYSNDWIGLNSRGIFHHIGDHVGFFYGAKSVGNCYFLGRNQSNHLVTLSTPYGRADTEQGYDWAKNYYKLFAHVHPTDFKYVYGVPKGNPELFDSPMFISSEVEDCQQNNTKNVVAAEHFWNNPVFMKNTGRKMFVGSIEDKFKDIFHNIIDLFDEKQKEIIQKLINNEDVWKDDLIKNNLTNDTFAEDKRSEVLQKSSFFMKSLAHKTVCEIINPIENLELGFFMKHNGSAPLVKKFFIFNLLQFKKRQKKLSKPLNHMKEVFINLFLTQDKDFVNLWSGEDKKGYLFSEIVTMRNEYRMFIINNRVVSTSACFRNTVPLNAWQNGRFDPRLVNGHNDQQTHINRDRVAKYAKFARQFCQEMKKNNPECHSYVLDVAWCDEKATVVPIEINSITWSGAYQINMHRVCSATIKKPFDYQNLDLFLQEKSEMWLRLIEDNIIDPSMYDLCGLDRTLKGNTQPNLQYTLNSLEKSVERHIKISAQLKEERAKQLIVELTKSLEPLTPESSDKAIDENTLKLFNEIDKNIDILDEDLTIYDDDDDDEYPLDTDEESKEK